MLVKPFFIEQILILIYHNMDEEENEPFRIQVTNEDINDEYSIDIVNQLSSILSEEISISIDKEIMGNLMFMGYVPKYEALVRENKINELMGTDTIDIMKELDIDISMLNRLEEDYNSSLNNNI